MAVAFLAAACADLEYEEYESPGAEDIQDGPGIFTGKSGEWVIYSR